MLDPKDPFFQTAIANMIDERVDPLGVLVRQLQGAAPTWIVPALSNSWVAFSGTDSQPGYYKDSNGIVRVRGLVKNGSAANAVIFTLPAGCRPAYNVWVAGTANDAFCSLRVLSTGEVNADAGGSTTWTSMDSITFLAEQ